MDDVEKLYNEGKLLARAMDLPANLPREGYYDCTVWADEFLRMMNNNYSSVSSTLIIPGVAVSLYKSIGFLVNSDLADCFHISKSDSGSCGNILDGDFKANKADFKSISELANYIKNNKVREMNEVNFNANIDSVVGLFFQKCNNLRYQSDCLIGIYVIKKCLELLTNIDFPVYMYDRVNGSIKKVEITKDYEEQINESLDIHNIFCWPEDYSEPLIEDISNINTKTM